MYGHMQQSMQINLRNESRASALLCKECTLLVHIQLSNKNASHADCALADFMSTVMCGAMISLTPCIAPKGDRECDLHEYAEFHDADDMIQKLNDILSKPDGFPQIPIPRKDCHTLVLPPPNKRHKQYVICPEQDCECLVYMLDQNTSMVEAIGLHDHPWWRKRVEELYSWYTKSMKTSKDAWTWEEGKNTSKWSNTRGSSKRGQSVPVDPASRPDPAEKGLPWKDKEPMDTSHDFLYPDSSTQSPAVPCPVAKADQLSQEQQIDYIQWIEHVLKIDRKTSKDPRVYCAYCDMNNHPRFTCKHAWKHRKPNEKHRCTLCAGLHPPFLCPIAQINGGQAQPNWYKVEYRRAKQENREADYRWGADQVTHTDVDGPLEGSHVPAEAPQPQCAAAAMMHGLSRPPVSSYQGGCPTIAEHQEFMPPMQPPMQPTSR